MVTIQAVAAPSSSDVTKITSGVVWDLETGPLSWPKIERIVGKFSPADVDLSKIPGGLPFDPASVNCGNLKPENKIAKIDAAREKHRADAAQYEKRCAAAIREAKELHKFKAIEKSALSATTGRILLSGLWDASSDEYRMLSNDKSEAAIIRETWRLLESARQVIGHNILGFDLPFIYRRAKILGVEMPRGLLELYRGRMYWSEKFVDLMEVWRAGTRDYISLNELAIALEVGEKNDDGSLFHEMWATDKPRALAYSRNDLDLIAGCAGRLLA